MGTTRTRLRYGSAPRPLFRHRPTYVSSPASIAAQIQTSAPPQGRHGTDGGRPSPQPRHEGAAGMAGGANIAAGAQSALPRDAIGRPRSHAIRLGFRRLRLSGARVLGGRDPGMPHLAVVLPLVGIGQAARRLNARVHCR